jgi:hypothetical protein
VADDLQRLIAKAEAAADAVVANRRAVWRWRMATLAVLLAWVAREVLRG